MPERAICVLAAHPYPSRSRAHHWLLEQIATLGDVDVRRLYDRYPDFDIDVAAEQRAVEAAGLIVWLHPLYWYGAPALLKHWFDRVLSKGWAHGPEGTALRGKDCLWVVSTGGDETAYSTQGRHAHRFEDFVPPIEQTARYCGLRWLEPFVIHGAHEVSEEALRAGAAALRARLAAWRAG